MPVESIQALLDSYNELQKTGVVRLGYASDKQLCFLFKRGDLVNTYLVTPEKWESMLPRQGFDWMQSAGAAYAKSVPFSATGLLLTKLLIQANGSQPEILESQRLAEYLDSRQRKAETVLLHLAWKNAAGAVFFDAGVDPRFIFVSHEAMLDQSGNYQALYLWDEPHCEITSFAPDVSNSVWQEYYLRSAFASICERLLVRFEVLTGRAFVDSLVRLMAAFASRQNLDITIFQRKLVDNEVFPSPQESVRNYRMLLTEIFQHFSAIIGLRLHSSILREIIKDIPEREREMIRMFNLLPKGYYYE